MEIYRYLWHILSLDKYSQGVSQLHKKLCKTHKQNTHVQHSYTHRTVKHPRPQALSIQEVIHIWITSSAQGLTQSTHAADASRISTGWGKVQAYVISVYPSVCHSVSLSVTHTHTHTHTHIDSYNTTHTQIHLISLTVTHTLTHRHRCPTREVSCLLLSYTCALWVQIPPASFCYLNPHFLSRRPRVQR